MTLKISQTSKLLIISQQETISLILSIYLKTPRPRKVKITKQGQKISNSPPLKSPNSEIYSQVLSRTSFGGGGKNKSPTPYSQQPTQTQSRVPVVVPTVSTVNALQWVGPGYCCVQSTTLVRDGSTGKKRNTHREDTTDLKLNSPKRKSQASDKQLHSLFQPTPKQSYAYHSSPIVTREFHTTLKLHFTS